MCSSIHLFNYDKKVSDFENPGCQTHELTQLPTYPPMTGRFFLVDGGWRIADKVENLAILHPCNMRFPKKGRNV